MIFQGLCGQTVEKAVDVLCIPKGLKEKFKVAQKTGREGRAISMVRKPRVLVVLVFSLFLSLLYPPLRGTGKGELGISNFQSSRIEQASSRTGSELIGKGAPDFTLKSVTGAPVRLSDFKGKVVLIDFWHTY